MTGEVLDIVNERGEIIGYASRAEIHRKQLLHRVVHLLIFDSAGRLLLQKRSLAKDVAPGVWDTSVGGHIDRGESVDDALRREMHEELGLRDCDPEFLYTYIHTNEKESELVYSFRCCTDEVNSFNPQEIEEIRFWNLEEIAITIHSDIFSEHFKDEFRRYMSLMRERR